MRKRPHGRGQSYLWSRKTRRGKGRFFDLFRGASIVRCACCQRPKTAAPRC
ncbi:MAG: hypothetical protein ACI4QC_06685 [Thermoguttaceae bacterium]